MGMTAPSEVRPGPPRSDCATGGYPPLAGATFRGMHEPSFQKLRTGNKLTLDLKCKRLHSGYIIEAST
jgi:hypothetical protein